MMLARIQTQRAKVLSGINPLTAFIDWHYGRCDAARRDEWEALLYKWLAWALLLIGFKPLWLAMLLGLVRVGMAPETWLLFGIALWTRRDRR